MSKKIAQLTKVIYYLNTKNEDHNVEIQSLIDAYEDELAEVIKDGTSQVADLKIQLETTELKVVDAEKMIQTYVNTIQNQEEELRNCYTREEALKEQVQDIARRTSEELESNLRNMEDLTQSQQLEREMNMSVQMREMREKHREEMDKLQADNAKSLKQLMDDLKNAQTLVKDTMSNMAQQLDDQKQTFQREIDRLKADHDKEIKALEAQYTATQKQLEEEVEHMTKRYKEVSESLAENQQTVRIQRTEINELNETMMKKDQFVREAQGKLNDLNEKLTDTKLDLQMTIEKLDEADKRIQEQDLQLQERASQLFEMESDFKTCKDELENAYFDFRNLQANFESAQLYINELSSNLYETSKTKAELEVMKVEAERKVVKLLADIDQITSDLTMKMLNALDEQSNRLTAAAEKKLTETEAKIHADYKIIVDQKDSEMVETLKSHKQELLDWADKIRKEQDKFVEMKDFMQDQLDKMEEAKNVVKEKLESSTKTIQEKVNEIQELQRTVAANIASIKALEVDKADLYQKMVRIDDQIRGEMNEKFRHEKMESEERWEIFHATEMQNLKDKMTHEHHVELMTAIDKTETDYKEQMSRLIAEHELRTEEYLKTKTELEDKVMGLEINIKMLTKGVHDLKEDHTRKLANVLDSHEKFLEKERKNFEYEMNAKETQLKVASTIALGNLEKKHAAVLEEVELAHKKMMDDLRNTNTKNALAAKKEAENKLAAEVLRLKGVQAEELQAQANKFQDEMAQTILTMNMARMAELKDQADLHQLEIEKINKKVDSLNEDIIRRIGVESDYSRKVYSLESEIMKLKDNVASKINEITKLRDRHIIALDEQMESLMKEHDAKVYNLNEEHIIEANKMIKDFEKAQDFLKMQIAHQAKLLEEAALKYVNRESRDDDVAKIAELEEDIKKRKKKAHTMMEELEYCKLELSNREANFNKIFNKHPLVGVIQPITMGNSKDKKTMPKKSNSMSKLPPLYSPTMTPLPPALQSISICRPSEKGELP
ncbi:UNVERIFIED_CONTAM: hypothetical protein HDU68_006785 [Siphonaria sp. JEL0065]|nr:hypothetical protein HDU68_006785 [Siphonaria sp. JEL0065]